MTKVIENSRPAINIYKGSRFSECGKARRASVFHRLLATCCVRHFSAENGGRMINQSIGIGKG